MSVECQTSDWALLDDWWDVFIKTPQSRRRTSSARVLAKSGFSNSWSEIDPWWQAYSDSSLPALDSSSGGDPVRDQLTDVWGELDPWWDAYIEAGHETAERIAELLEQSNEQWESSDAPFDTDPLAVDLKRMGMGRGPLQPTNEVGWSLWLARLLRPSGLLVSELFDVEVDQASMKVAREEQLSKGKGPTRRPDLLVIGDEQGVSIEVKLGDENYRKTSHTASLVEDHYEDPTWTHTLLLPERKKGRLDSIVEPGLDRQPNGRHTVPWDDPGEVDVIYWRDMTRAIRSVLRRGDAVDSHWAANAYLFCAIVEQRILDFQPQSVIEGMANPGNVVDTIQPITFADTLEEELMYLLEQVDP